MKKKIQLANLRKTEILGAIRLIIEPDAKKWENRV